MRSYVKELGLDVEMPSEKTVDDVVRHIMARLGVVGRQGNPRLKFIPLSIFTREHRQNQRAYQDHGCGIA